MRPGQAAPEFRAAGVPAGRSARRFNEAGAGCPGIHFAQRQRSLPNRASMRPGQAAPEFDESLIGDIDGVFGFNEAGAGCPGIRRYRRRKHRSGAGFNEAGAGCPGIPRAGVHNRAGNFQASMRPGQAAPEFRDHARSRFRPHRASMRPGQAAPEFWRAFRKRETET